MGLHPGLQIGLTLATPLIKQDRTLPVAERRAKADLGDTLVIRMSRPTTKPLTVSDEVVAVEGGTITVRVYTPLPDGQRTAPFGAHLYIHGGAFWLGTLDGYDPLCRWYAAEAGIVVVSVGYRLAPEKKYPTQVNDCYAAWLWLHDNAERLGVDPSSVSVGGTSAGGSLAAAVALMARDRSGPIPVLQVLEIPTTDASMDYPSVARYGKGYGLTRADMEEAMDFYLADPAQKDESYASPVRTPDLSGLPPAAVFTCECDPLSGQGEAYGRRLRQAGVPTTIRRYRGHIHSSTYFTRLFASARGYLADITTVLRETHAGAKRTSSGKAGTTVRLLGDTALTARRGVEVL